MTTDLARTDDSPRGLAVADPEAAAGALAHVLGTGDLAKLSDKQRVGHYLDVCQSLGLNPRTRPFDWIEFYDPQTKAKKLALYPNRSCAEQLRRQHQISVKVTRREMVGELFVVEVEGRTPNGRTGTASKYVPVTYTDRDGKTTRLSGNQLANAYMKAETGAFRRLTFSMVGMASPPDVEELSRARVVVVDGTGRVLEAPSPEQKMLAENPAAARVIGEPTFETVGNAEAAPLAGTSSQRVRPDELVRPERPAGPPPSFKNSDEQIATWRAAWFATVKGLSLDTDAARAAFIAQWSADEWPKAKRTDSLATFLARATPAEVEEMLGYVRGLMEDERRELLAMSYENMPDPEPPARPDVDRRVHDSVQLTGGPATADDDAAPAF
jgi:hypothetical protein